MPGPPCATDGRPVLFTKLSFASFPSNVSRLTFWAGHVTSQNV